MSEELHKRIEELENESAERLAGWQRARADYQNIKRESEERVMRAHAEAKLMLLREALPIYDHLRQATQHKPDDAHVDSWIEGIIRIREQFDALLKKWHVQSVPTVGQEFDPHQHEAVETTGDGDEVTRELQAGYRVGDQLIYPAKVAVGKSGPTKPSNNEQDQNI